MFVEFCDFFFQVYEATAKSTIWVGPALPLCSPRSLGWYFLLRWEARNLLQTLCHSSKKTRREQDHREKSAVKTAEHFGQATSQIPPASIARFWPCYLSLCTPGTNLRSRGDTETTISTHLRFLLLCISHLGALLLCSFSPWGQTELSDYHKWMFHNSYLPASQPIQSQQCTSTTQVKYIKSSLHSWNRWHTMVHKLLLIRR